MVSNSRIVMALGVLVLIIGFIVTLLGQVDYAGLDLDNNSLLGLPVETRGTGLVLLGIGIVFARMSCALPKE